MNTKYERPAAEHQKTKIYVLVSLTLLVINTGLLLLMFVPLLGIYLGSVLAPIFLANGVFGLINILVAVRILHKNRMARKWKDITVIILILSIIATLAGIQALGVLVDQRIQHAQNQQQRGEENKKYSTVTIEKTTELLQQCQIHDISYNFGGVEDGEPDPEKTSTGILTYNEPSYGAPVPDGRPADTSWVHGNHTLLLANRMVDTIVPIARQAQNRCGIGFYHDSESEQYQNGHWYFKGKLVN